MLHWGFVLFFESIKNIHVHLAFISMVHFFVKFIFLYIINDYDLSACKKGRLICLLFTAFFFSCEKSKYKVKGCHSTLYAYKRDLIGIAKSIDPGQPVQSTQADQSKLFAIGRFSVFL